MSDWNKNFTKPTPDEFLGELRKTNKLIEKLAIDGIAMYSPKDDYIIYNGDLVTDGTI